MLKEGVIFSSTHITSKLIVEMLKGLFHVYEATSYSSFKNLIKEKDLDFIIIDRTLKDITSKEIFDKLVEDGIENIPPSILLVQDRYNPELDGDGYSFILRKPFLKMELIEAINFVIVDTQKKEIKKILIVDDSQTSRKIIRKKLNSLGYSTIEAELPSKALEIINSEKPDVIIVDYLMPEMNGVELAKRLSQNDKLLDVPIILLTGTKNIEKIMEEGFNSGISAYFQKPIKEEELASFFTRYLKKDLSCRILIVDDSYTKRKILYSNLQVNSNRVITAESIAKAKTFFEDNHFDIILIDLVLKGENAYDAIRIFRKMNKIIPIIVYSSIADRKNIYKVLELGANDYLWSPIEMKELILKTQIWVEFYRIFLENESLKIKKIKEEKKDFIEILDEKFSISKVKNIVSTLVYFDNVDENNKSEIINCFRSTDLHGFYKNKFFVFFENSTYVNTLKICKRIGNYLKKSIKIGIASTNTCSTVEELIKEAEKNLIELK